MAQATKQGLQFSATEETTKGTPEAVSSSDFIECVDSITLNNTRDKKELAIMSGSKLKKKSVRTIQRGDGAINSYMRAGENAGDRPETDVLLKSLGLTPQDSTVTASTGSNSTTVINVASGDELKYKVGSIILIKDSVNGDHISPISALADGVVTILVPAASTIDDSASIQACVNYKVDGLQDTSFTARKWFNEVQKQEVPYCKTSNATFGPFTSGEPVTNEFTFSGINFTEANEAIGVTPEYDDTDIPFAIDACLYKDGVAIEANECSFTIENALTAKETLCAENGLVSQEGIGVINISGSCNVFKDDQTSDFLIDDSKYSLFISVYVPGASDGDKENVVGIFLPVVKTDERDSNADIDGNMILTISFSAEPSDSEETFPVIMFS